MDVGSSTLEKIRIRKTVMKIQSFNLFIYIVVSLLFSCTSTELKYKKGETFFKNEEFENAVKIESTETEKIITTITDGGTASSPQKIANQANTQSQTHLQKKQIDPQKKSARTSQNKASVLKSIKNEQTQKRQPELEDFEGFVAGSRRPQVDPFKIGEKVVHAVKYFSAEAGRLTLEVKPYAQVNNKKSYHFSIGLKSSRLFSNFYSVDDQVDTFLDYETLVPYVLKINIKETGKLAQAQSVFDHQKLNAKFWEKKYTTKNGEEEKKYEWDILPFSQNAYSGLFYMRIFNWKVGKEISFYVAEDEKNIVFKGTAIAKETLETEAGLFQAYKIKASILSRGALTQTGDVYMWVSDDEHKYLLRIEAKIKIGSLVSEIVELRPGN